MSVIGDSDCIAPMQKRMEVHYKIAVIHIVRVQSFLVLFYSMKSNRKLD